MNMKRAAYGCWVVAALLMVAPDAEAATQTWINATTGEWNTPGNWLSAVPGTTDVAHLTNAAVGYVVNYDTPMSAAYIRSLLFTSSATLNINTNGFRIQDDASAVNGGLVYLTKTTILNINSNGCFSHTLGLNNQRTYLSGTTTINSAAFTNSAGQLFLDGKMRVVGSRFMDYSVYPDGTRLGNNLAGPTNTFDLINSYAYFRYGLNIGYAAVAANVAVFCVSNSDVLVQGTTSSMGLRLGMAAGKGRLYIYSGSVTNEATAGTSALQIGSVANSEGLIEITGGRLVNRGGGGGGGYENNIVSVKVGPTTDVRANGTLNLLGGTFISANMMIGTVAAPIQAQTNQVLVGGGTHYVTNTTRSAYLNVINGMLTVTGGVLSVDALIMTNAIGSAVVNGGSINLYKSTVSNGQAFAMSGGTLRLTGGTNFFADGFVASNGAALAGTGVVTGGVTLASGGTFSPGDTNTLGTLTIDGNAILQDGAEYRWNSASNGADRVVVNGTLTLPAAATVRITMLDAGPMTNRLLFSATVLAGETDLSGWTVRGARATIENATNVVLTPVPNGAVFTLR